MNYYPFYNYIGGPYHNNVGLIKRLFGNINLSNIITKTEKTLNFVNQTIPMVKQVSPLIKNTKTMFKVMNEFKKSDTKPKETITIIEKENKKAAPEISTADNSPTFFI